MEASSAPMSAQASSTTAATRGTGRGGVRGGGDFRGGRGGDTRRGGRGTGLSRGAGRGRGDASGRGRGRGRGDGGERGRRGGRGYVPKKALRHRSLSGKHGTHAPREGAPPAKREKKEQKPSSNFALLYSMLGDAATIAEYVREYHSSEKFREAKPVNTFLQAVSHRPAAVYEQLMAEHKDEIFTTLERLFALYALGKNAMTPSAHEFLIRCEQEGVRKSSWGEGVRSLPAKAPEPEANADGEVESVVQAPAPVAPALDAETASLLSARELLKKLAARDPVGRLQRLIEMSTTVEDLQGCARRVSGLTAEAEAEEEQGSGSEAAGKLDYAAKCQLISKLLSKARRIVEPAFPPPAKEEKPEDEAEDTVGKVDEEDLRDGADDVEEVAASSSTAAAAPAPAAPAPRRGPLTTDEVASFRAVVSSAFAALETVLEQRAANVPQQPLFKFTKVLEWCKERSLLAPGDERFLALLEQQVEKDIVEQATQLETVINLKSLTAGDSAALRAVVDQLWEAGSGKAFAPSSVDVLSAIAVAASGDGIEADVKRLTSDRLVQTQRHLSDTVVLPRRALRFVNDERNKVKQAAIAKQLQEEASKYAHAEEVAADEE